MFFRLLLSLLILALFACKNENRVSRYLNPEVLPQQVFTIQNNQDTVLTTAGGALLKIDRGTFDGEATQLEVREAYSISDIVQSGLLTESNGQPLSSGGMIYINGTGGERLRFNKSASVSVPTEYL
ncbi:MAG TPA: hypothetical protein VHK69_16300, partial [Chitinophagaceae bacterium]|nr:hypothetical protein [Chitinophagaceae bacterium]